MKAERVGREFEAEFSRRITGRTSDTTVGGTVVHVAVAVSAGLFEVEQTNDTIIVVPSVDLRELEYQRIEEGARRILDLLNGAGAKNVVVDFCKTDYYGSTAHGFFVKLWKRVRGKGGWMAFCNVSPHEKEILQVTHLDGLWPTCPSRIEALEAVSK